jgi:hypothetical protein
MSSTVSAEVSRFLVGNKWGFAVVSSTCCSWVSDYVTLWELSLHPADTLQKDFYLIVFLPSQASLSPIIFQRDFARQ